MAMGVRRPGLTLLSLSPTDTPAGTPAHTDTPCLLPDQIGVYTRVYAPLGVLSLFLLLFARVRGSTRGRAYSVVAQEERESGMRMRVRSSSVGVLPPPGGGAARRAGRRRWLWLRDQAGPDSALADRPGKASGRERGTFVGALARDVRDAAWPPVLLFALITLWAFW